MEGGKLGDSSGSRFWRGFGCREVFRSPQCFHKCRTAFGPNLMVPLRWRAHSGNAVKIGKINILKLCDHQKWGASLQNTHGEIEPGYTPLGVSHLERGLGSCSENAGPCAPSSWAVFFFNSSLLRLVISGTTPK